jgi:hypothetical protein
MTRPAPLVKPPLAHRGRDTDQHLQFGRQDLGVQHVPGQPGVTFKQHEVSVIAGSDQDQRRECAPAPSALATTMRPVRRSSNSQLGKVRLTVATNSSNSAPRRALLPSNEPRCKQPTIRFTRALKPPDLLLGGA